MMYDEFYASERRKYASDEEIAACAESRAALERRRANIHRKIQDAWQKHLMDEVKHRAAGACSHWINSLGVGELEIAEFKLELIGVDNFLETWESQRDYVEYILDFSARLWPFRRRGIGRRPRAPARRSGVLFGRFAVVTLPNPVRARLHDGPRRARPRRWAVV